jgi:alanine dehydrogenase
MTIIITDEDVRGLLSMPECIEAMRVAFTDLADGQAANMPRMRYSVPTKTVNKQYLANIQAGAVPSFGVAAVRAGSRFMQFEETNGQRRVLHNPDPKNWTVIVLYDLETAEPLAFIHESHISGIRVGATVGLAVDHLAKKNSEILALFGSGAQAGPILEAITSVRALSEIRVYSPTRSNREAFAQKYRQQGLNVLVRDKPDNLVPGADIVACATNTAEPVFESCQLEKGQTLITIVNSDVTGRREEVDPEVFGKASRVIINDWDSVHANSQIELLEAIDSGSIARQNIATLGEVVSGRVQGRQSDEEIVYYKNNTGLGMQFAAAGGLVFRKMKDRKTRMEIPTNWLGSEVT